jgi:pyruvate/2-oxoglutarate dehydrogenase complex dihydrolipoamide acyltransferase (E2) component
MPTQVLMPQLGESVNEGTISRWLKAEGDPVDEYDPLLEINTDKVDTEIPSPTTGILLKILVSEGEVVEVGTPLALIGEPGETPQETDGGGEEPVSPAETKETEAEAVPGVPEAAAALATGRDRDLGFISPVVARIASEQNVDLTQVQGTGKGGRITKKDILAYVDKRGAPATDGAREEPATPAAPAVPKKAVREPDKAAQPAAGAPPPPAPSAPAAGPGETLPLTPVRRSIAEHMVLSKHTSPHVTTVMEADLSLVVAHRQANKADFSRRGINLTFTPYFTAAAVAALKAYPLVNSSWSDEGIRLHPSINIGIATSLGDEGLIVPVLKNADGLSLLGLARAINDLAARARSRQLKPDEVKEGTFTITNHGISGSLIATPIINQPQCGILGVGAIQKRVVVVDGPAGEDAIAICPMVYISLTFDHRILDGAIADHFLAKVVESLQNWT